jgi:hypothetical protein
MPTLLSFLLVLCFFASPLQAASVQFAARQDIATGFQHLTGLAVADFNGDGFPDIAVTDDYANQVTVYLNDGHGGFSKPTVTNLPASGYAGLGYLVSGDVNEDGKQDLIVGPIGGLQYDVVLLGNGDGTFTPGAVLKSTYGFNNAQLLDINGDKHLDLVSAGNPRVFIELGDGKGNFTDASIPSTETPLTFNTGLAVADFNKDGHQDLLTSAYNTLQLQYFAGAGDGTFAKPATYAPQIIGSSGASLIAADFNGDGNQDVLFSTDYAVVVVLGNGDGTFKLNNDQLISPAIPYVPPSAIINTVSPVIATADVDGSGTPDIVVADDNSGFLSVFLNNGTGQFSQSAPDFTAPIDPGNGQIRLADLNGDGLPDIVITNFKTQKISVFLSVIPKSTPTVTVASSAGQVLVGGTATINVQVKSSGSHVPTGAVALASGSTSFGQQTLDANGQASFILSNLAAGQYSLTATYAGDKYNNSASNAATFSESVTDFQVALPTVSQSIPVNGTATYNLNLTPVAGFNGTVTLSCSGLPSAYVCASSSTSIAGQPTSVSLVVSPAPSNATARPTFPTTRRSQTTLAVLGFASLCFCFRKRRLPGLFAVILSFGLVSALAGCSNSGSSGPPPYVGTSNFTITAAATQGSVTVSHQTTATLTVHQ